MTSIEAALAQLDPISLDEANRIAQLQTRIDRKYVVDEATLEALLAELGPSLRVLDINGDRSCAYRSTYFDTEDLTLYRAAVQGRRHRHKIRSRTYGEAGPCYLEVKAKGRRGANVKSRITYCRSDHGTITANGHDFVEEATGGQGLARALLPVLTTQYERSTLIDAASRTRLTFDRHVRCANLVGGVPTDEAALDAIIVETKSTRAPSAADRWLWEHHRRPTKISKFCTGLAATSPELPANKWHTVIARHWQTASVDQAAAQPTSGR